MNELTSDENRRGITPRGFATILTRGLGLWFVLEGVFQMAELLRWTPPPANAAGSDWTSYPALDPSTMNGLFLHDTYYVVADGTWNYLVPALKVLIGVLLLVCARRIARLLATGVE